MTRFVPQCNPLVRRPRAVLATIAVTLLTVNFFLLPASGAQSIRIKIVDQDGKGISFFRYDNTAPLIKWKSGLLVCDASDDTPLFPIYPQFSHANPTYELNYTNCSPKILIEVLKGSSTVSNIWLDNASWWGVEKTVSVPEDGLYTIRVSTTFQFEDTTTQLIPNQGTMYDDQGHFLVPPAPGSFDGRGQYEVWKIEFSGSGPWQYKYYKRYTYNYVGIVKTHVSAGEADTAVVVLPQTPELWAAMAHPTSDAYHYQEWSAANSLARSTAKQSISATLRTFLKFPNTLTVDGIGGSLVNSHIANIIFASATPDDDFNLNSVITTAIGSVATKVVVVKLGLGTISGGIAGVAIGLAVSAGEAAVNSYILWSNLEEPLAQGFGDDLLVSYVNNGGLFTTANIFNEGEALTNVNLGGLCEGSLEEYPGLGFTSLLDTGGSASYNYSSTLGLDCLDYESVLVFTPTIFAGHASRRLYFPLDEIREGVPTEFTIWLSTSPSNSGLNVTASNDGFQTSGSAFSKTFTQGASVILSVNSPQTGSDDGLYGFKQWSDGNTSLSRTITVTGDATYTAIFTNSGGLVLTATADAHVMEDVPDGHYGSNTGLAAASSQSLYGTTYGYVRFDGLSTIPRGSRVDSVELRLTRELTTQGSSPLYFNRVTEAWTESGITWNTRPTGQDIIVEGNRGSDAVWIFDSSSFPQLITVTSNWVSNPSTNFGFLFRFINETNLVGFHSRNAATASQRPKLVVAYRAPDDNTGDPIVNLVAKRSSTGGTISQNSWQKDNDPYFSWSTTNTVYPIVGYSFALNNSTPDNIVDVTVPYYQYSSDSISDGPHTFYVKSLDGNGNWGPVASFVIKVDATAPTGGTITINSGDASTWSPTVTLNSLGATDASSGVVQMKFSNDGGTWSSYESVVASKTNWSLFAYGGNTNAGVKTVYVRYKDNAGNESAIYSDTIVFDPAPQFTSQPTSFGIARGFDHEFAATAEGYEPLTFQWRFNGVDIPGATSAMLTVTNASPTNAGNYSVVVSNAYGLVVSTNAQLAIVAVVEAWAGNWGEQKEVPLDLTNVVAVAAGESHSIALRPDGTVAAWGDNGYGQCDVPTNLTNVVAIAAGGGVQFGSNSRGGGVLLGSIQN